MQNKSFHNLKSIKKLTIKILKRYYDTHFYNKNKKEKIAFNLDTTKSFLDNGPSFIKNIDKSIHNINNKNYKRKTQKLNTNNNINKNKLFIGYEKKRNNSTDIFGNVLNFSSDSFSSNSSNNSNSNFQTSNKSISAFSR